MLKLFFKTKYFEFWIIVAIAITFSAAMTYLAVQQSLRLTANDPQIQIAEDIASELAQGANPSDLNAQSRTDIERSLLPFLIVYDSNGQPISSTAQLDGNVPALPSGVLESAQKNGENRITWQPKSGTRVALVVVPYSGASGNGYVAAGRSLREIEARENNNLMIVLITWVAALIITLGAAIVLQKLRPDKANKE